MLKLDANFNPRAHEGHDYGSLCVPLPEPISIHVPTRGTTSYLHLQQALTDFNPRAHEGHDPANSALLTILAISIHVPTRGTTPLMPGISIDMADFNPRAHEGHDAVAIRLDRGDAFQSTCPRGARLQDVACLCELWISIHVPTRGTTKRAGQDTLARYFNPRAHEGHDYARRYSIRVSGFQSTCPRGARLPVFLYYQVLPGFQSTCPRGARRAFCYLAIQITPFQSTCPRGARRYCGCKSSKLFISIHVPTRGTTHMSKKALETCKFQSTCPRGARPYRLTIYKHRAISIHVPTRGTTECAFAGRRVRIFQSTCPRGARRVNTGLTGDITPFQSTCPRGARHLRGFSNPYKVYFNPRAHEGHDAHNRRNGCHGKFQSTCPRGARRDYFYAAVSGHYFNPRAHEGHD